MTDIGESFLWASGSECIDHWITQQHSYYTHSTWLRSPGLRDFRYPCPRWHSTVSEWCVDLGSLTLGISLNINTMWMSKSSLNEPINKWRGRCLEEDIKQQQSMHDSKVTRLVFKQMLQVIGFMLIQAQNRPPVSSCTNAATDSQNSYGTLLGAWL